MLTTAILAWLHILSAISWLGGGILFGFVVGPAIPKLSTVSSAEFFVRVAPRIARFFQIMAGSTILFGALLAYTGVSNGDFPGLSPSTTWGLSIMIGLSLGVVAFVVGELLAVPALNRVIRIFSEMQTSGQREPPAELGKAIGRARFTATATVGLLILTLVFMVAAGFY